MDTTIHIEVPRERIVPTQNRAKWLDEHGVPPRLTRLDFEVPVQLAEDAGYHLEPDGAAKANGVKAHNLLEERAIQALREGRTFEVQDVTAILRSEAKRRADEARQAAEKHNAMLLAQQQLTDEWLALEDDEAIRIYSGGSGTWHGTVLQYKSAALPETKGPWRSDGYQVLADRPEVQAALSRRRELACELADQMEAEAQAEEAGKLEELHEWAMERSPRVQAGLRRGYDMNGTIGQLVFEHLRELLLAELDIDDDDWRQIEVRQVVEGSREYHAAKFLTKKNPSSKALCVVEACEHALKKAELPSCVEVDTPEVVTAYVDDGSRTCVAVEVDAYSLGHRIVCLDIDHLQD